jgi:glycosyltransferase involved in cell wall biosynthesis
MIFVGRLSTDKGCHVLLEAFRRCATQDRKMRLTVIGDGDERDRCEAFCGENNISEQVTFTGTLTKDQVIPFLRHARAVIFPSISETYGLAAVEAMACGAPVIASDTGGLRDTVGQAGILFPPADCTVLAEILMRVHRDSCLRAQLRQSALTFASRQKTDRVMAEEHGQLYRRIAGL